MTGVLTGRHAVELGSLMRLVILPCLILAGIAACAAPSGPSSSGPRMPVDLASALDSISADDLLRHTKTLASDEYEGRSPGTKGEELTVKYLVDEFRQIGLAPGNPDGTYLQKVPLAGFTAEPHFSILAGGRRTTWKFPDDYVAVSRRFVPEVKVENSDVVFVGYGVVAPEYGWDDYKGVDVRGKTIVMLVNDPAVPDPNDPAKLDDAMFRGKAMTYYGRWTYKYEIASEKGAAAAILVHETGPAGYPVRGRRRQLGARELRHRRRPTANRPASRSRGGSRLETRQGALRRRRAGLRRAQASRRHEGLPARPAERQGDASTIKNTIREVAVAQRRRAARGVRPGSKDESRRLHRPLGPPGPRTTTLAGRPDLQRRARQRLGRGRPARDRRRRSRRSRSPTEAIGPLPGGDRRGEGPARREVLRDASALPARADAGEHQHGRHQPLGPDERHRQHRPAANSTLDDLAASRSREGRGGSSRPTPSPRRASSTAPTTSSSPSRACRRSTRTRGRSIIGKPADYGRQKRDEYTAERLPQAVATR